MINIYVEGLDDKNFVSNFIVRNGTNNKGYKIEETGGWQKLKLVRNVIEQNKDTGGFNYIIFDADNNFPQRLIDIHKLIDMSKVDGIFLFPDHNGSGNLETLLINIAHNNHQQILTCFDGYRNCVSMHNATYITPDDKAKIFAYLACLNTQTKVGYRDYTDNTIWNLGSPLLNNFLQFIHSIF